MFMWIEGRVNHLNSSGWRLKKRGLSKPSEVTSKEKLFYYVNVGHFGISSCYTLGLEVHGKKKNWYINDNPISRFHPKLLLIRLRLFFSRKNKDS